MTSDTEIIPDFYASYTPICVLLVPITEPATLWVGTHLLSRRKDALPEIQISHVGFPDVAAGIVNSGLTIANTQTGMLATREGIKQAQITVA